LTKVQKILPQNKVDQKMTLVTSRTRKLDQMVCFLIFNCHFYKYVSICFFYLLSKTCLCWKLSDTDLIRTMHAMVTMLRLLLPNLTCLSVRLCWPLSAEKKVWSARCMWSNKRRSSFQWQLLRRMLSDIVT